LDPFVLEVLAKHRRTLPCRWGPRRRRSSWLAGPPLPALGHGGAPREPEDALVHDVGLKFVYTQANRFLCSDQMRCCGIIISREWLATKTGSSANFHFILRNTVTMMLAALKAQPAKCPRNHAERHLLFPGILLQNPRKPSDALDLAKDLAICPLALARVMSCPQNKAMRVQTSPLLTPRTSTKPS